MKQAVDSFANLKLLELRLIALSSNLQEEAIIYIANQIGSKYQSLQELTFFPIGDEITANALKELGNHLSSHKSLTKLFVCIHESNADLTIEQVYDFANQIAKIPNLSHLIIVFHPDYLEEEDQAKNLARILSPIPHLEMDKIMMH